MFSFVVSLLGLSAFMPFMYAVADVPLVMQAAVFVALATVVAVLAVVWVVAILAIV